MSSSLALTRPIKPKGHAPLRTLDDVCGYVISLPGNIARLRVWKTVGILAFDARNNNPTDPALDELTRKVELALLLTHRLDPKVLLADLLTP